jgi:hypothetical protein
MSYVVEQLGCAGSLGRLVHDPLQGVIAGLGKRLTT